MKLQITSLLLTTVLLSGCADLPGNGPSDEAIEGSAATRLENDAVTLGYDYALVDITREILPHITVDAPNSFKSFGTGSDAAPEIRLGIGDVVQLTVFESRAGGLFIPDDAGARPGNFVVLPPQQISRAGTITVPYAGKIKAAGVTTDALENTIVRLLQDRAIEPQVSVAVLQQNFPRVSVLGDVGAPGIVTLRNSGDRLLDLIAQRGGIVGEPHASFLTVTRGAQSVTVPYEVVTETPRENIFAAPGDAINVTTDPKRFYVFGATGTVGEFEFDEAQIDLNGAIARARGLLDGRADPAQVLIFRHEHEKSLYGMGADLKEMKQFGGQVPTIYRADFRKPDSFFMSQRFQVRDGDVIYVSNADAVEITKFFGIATTVTGGTRAIDADIDVLAGPTP